MSVATGKITIGCNRKLGCGVGSLNRVPAHTCPGRSKWCSRNCYGHKGLFTLWYSDYEKTIKVPEKMPSVFRFHGVGDFDSKEYINWCISLVRNNRGTNFWAYTKSWRISELVEHLKKLNSEPNMQLFASMDPSIKENPPSYLRASWVEIDNRRKGTYCLHDAGIASTCKDCGFCWDKKSGDVIFKLK